MCDVAVGAAALGVVAFVLLPRVPSLIMMLRWMVLLWVPLMWIMLMLQFLDVVTVKITIVFLLPCSTCAVIASGAFAVGFLSKSLVFCEKRTIERFPQQNEQFKKREWANFFKKWTNERVRWKNKQFTHLLIFGERPERFAQNALYKEGISEFFKNFKNVH